MSVIKWDTAQFRSRWTYIVITASTSLTLASRVKSATVRVGGLSSSEISGFIDDIVPGDELSFGAAPQLVVCHE
jgi:hypothetical protein